MIKIQFKNTDEIVQYYQKQLDKGNYKAFDKIKPLNNSKPLITDKILIAEAKRLQSCIQKHINIHYSSYKPEHYERTFGLKEALKVDAKIETINGKKSIGLYFDDGRSWGKSVVNGSLSGYKPYLISGGFKNKSYENPHFLGFVGYDFIQKGMDDWKQNLKYDIDIVHVGTQGNLDMAERFGYTFE